MLELAEEDFVEEDLAALETLPGAVGAGGGDGVVDPVWRNVLALFVVEDGLEGGDDLGRAFSVRSSTLSRSVTHANTAYIE